MKLIAINHQICSLSSCVDHQLTKTTAQALACTVTTTWFGFYRLWRGSGIIFDTVELYLPKYSYESQVLYGCHNEFVTFDNHITG